ncbi:MAG TPA: SLBB domain-containing protein [Steroidobacteraceae bacterium]|jgi:protein involved in polysaccharide export with SLBB domain|nr:SLBB domain-containing protein [Steroidobacteraceae bacterium]
MRRVLALLAASWLFLAGMPPASAQVPTAEQLELLRSMSPEDREALMEQLGIGGAVIDQGSTGSQGTGQGGTNRDARNQQDRMRRLNGADDTLLPVDKTLKPEDSVLIDIDFKKDKPARVESPGQGLPPITIPAEPAPVLTDDERKELGLLINLVRSRNPYQLDATGTLQLPGFSPMVLAGLDEKQATHRLTAVDAFHNLDVKVSRLPVRKLGVAGLKPFGYDLFKDTNATFAPVTDVPVPSDYIVGPGDQLMVQLFGSTNRTLRLVVGRDGRIAFPELGPINVGGQSFARVAEEIEQRVARQMIGVRASVAMGDTRSIRVFVMGEANRPGSYTVSGLGTITSALYAAGGIKSIGSLRDIQLKRAGAVIRRIDLYDLLLRGDTSDDAKLNSGDVIFIPPVSATVAVDGEVHRPAIYEIRGTTTVGDVVRMAGGLTTEADSSRAALVRVNDARRRVVVDVPLDAAPGRDELVRNGDSLRILRLRPMLDQGVTVEGHVYRPGAMAWHEGMRITEVLGSVDELKPNADLNYVAIRRELPPDRRIVVVSADLAAALRNPGSAKDIKLMPRDRIIVFDQESGRQQLMAPLLDEMRRQSRIDAPSEVVRIDGRVKARGDYPLEPGMRLSDLLRAGGGLQDAAYGAKAELTRYRIGDDARTTQLLDIDLAAILKGDTSADILLQPFDFLNVKEVPEWSEQEQVTLLGEVRFPGTYPIQRGETLRSVLDRAGGLTKLAFPEGSVFTRQELQVREQEQIDRLAERLQSDLAAAALSAAAANQGQAGQALTVGQSLLTQLKSTKAVGRLVIDLGAVLDSPVGSANDVVLREGDHLIIPKQKQEVTVIGEVQNTTSHFFRQNYSRDDYIGLSGGVTRKADRGRIYVVRADGSVVSSENSGWFRRSGQVAMRPGDTIVVPLDTERMPALPLWQAVTSILYNLAIAAAAVNSF